MQPKHQHVINIYRTLHPVFFLKWILIVLSINLLLTMSMVVCLMIVMTNSEKKFTINQSC